MKPKNRLLGNILLLLAALIWGVSFVSQEVGAAYLEPFAFNSIRTIMGGIVLLPCIRLLDRLNPKRTIRTPGSKRALIIGGVVCGAVLFIASSLQQIGMTVTTSAGKAGFITAMYVVLVPLLGILLKRKVPLRVMLSAVLVMAGLYLLCIKQGFAVEAGDVYVLLCAFFFAVHIMAIDHFSPLVDGVRLSCLQFFVSGGIGLVFMLIFENPTYEQFKACIIPLLYSGIMSCGVAYTLQIIGQKHTEPAVACLLLSLESVFAALSGWLILNEQYSAKELLGCLLTFAAIILSQLPIRRPAAESNAENKELNVP